MELLIKLVTKENQTVLDMFTGSGTTGVACKNLGRKFVGIERDDKYYNIAKERITGEKESCSCVEPYLRCNADEHKQDCC